MGKGLSGMTLEELWELFPIFLVAHDDRRKIAVHSPDEVWRKEELLVVPDPDVNS